MPNVPNVPTEFGSEDIFPRYYLYYSLASSHFPFPRPDANNKEATCTIATAITGYHHVRRSCFGIFARTPTGSGNIGPPVYSLLLVS